MTLLVSVSKGLTICHGLKLCLHGVLVTGLRSNQSSLQCLSFLLSQCYCLLHRCRFFLELLDSVLVRPIFFTKMLL